KIRLARSSPMMLIFFMDGSFFLGVATIYPYGTSMPSERGRPPHQYLLMLALWSCGRRPCVVQAQRQIHRALRAALTIAEMIVRTIAEQPALTVPRRVARIDRHGSEYHSVRSSSAPLL